MMLAPTSFPKWLPPAVALEAQRILTYRIRRCCTCPSSCDGPAHEIGMAGNIETQIRAPEVGDTYYWFAPPTKRTANRPGGCICPALLEVVLFPETGG